MILQNKLLITLSIATTIALISLICYCLWRGMRSGVMILWSTWAGRGQPLKVYRDKAPVAFWLLFLIWLVLIAVILALMFHRINSLLSRGI